MTILSRQSTDSLKFLPEKKGIFHRVRTNNSKICRETQKTLNKLNNLEKEEQSRKYHAL